MSTRTRTARVKSVAPLEGFVLRVDFSDGTTCEVDLEDELWGPMFGPLRQDSGLFRHVRVDAELGTIVWLIGADMDPDVLHGDHPPSGLTLRPVNAGSVSQRTPMDGPARVRN